MQFKFFKTNTLFTVFFIFLLNSYVLIAQQAVPFKVRHQGYINGDMTLIANNIVNRTDGNNEANSPYNEISNKGKLNDEFEMNYIDVDTDATTFSSSSATLFLAGQENKKIVYAGLYWSATYLYNSGKGIKNEKFKAIDASREAYNQIKIKFPNQEMYTNVSGELIFDGIKTENFKESAPYVCYADITNLVLNTATPFGTYTVANIKSTVGKLSGGVAAGWTLFFVYEDATMTQKFITSYDGFAGITDRSIDIPFSGFQTLAEGKVTAKIACAALEGDVKLKGDQLLFKSSEAAKFSQLSNNFHDKTNVFNSSITIDNALFDKRYPNSQNTLGYDSFIMTIDNPDNSVIGNNTIDATVRLKTSGDRFFMFFNAFGVEIAKPTQSNELVQQISVDSSSVKKEQLVATTRTVRARAATKTKTTIVTDSTTKPTTPSVVSNSTAAVKELVAESPVITTIESTKVAESQAQKATQTRVKYGPNRMREKAIMSPSIEVKNLKKGYYIIANVFAKPYNAKRFIALLEANSIKANYFINPVNNYRYVYLSRHTTFEAADSLYNSNFNGKYLDTLWIMTINE